MARNVESLRILPSHSSVRQTTSAHRPSGHVRQHQLHVLNSSQRATLHAIGLQPGFSIERVSTSLSFRFGLDQLDTLTRIHTGFAFSELPFELQQSVISLVSARDLCLDGFDIALVLEGLRENSGPQNI